MYGLGFRGLAFNVWGWGEYSGGCVGDGGGVQCTQLLTRMPKDTLRCLPRPHSLWCGECTSSVAPGVGGGMKATVWCDTVLEEDGADSKKGNVEAL